MSLRHLHSSLHFNFFWNLKHIHVCQLEVLKTTVVDIVKRMLSPGWYIDVCQIYKHWNCFSLIMPQTQILYQPFRTAENLNIVFKHPEVFPSAPADVKTLQTEKAANLVGMLLQKLVKMLGGSYFNSFYLCTWLRLLPKLVEFLNCFSRWVSHKYSF